MKGEKVKGFLSVDGVRLAGIAAELPSTSVEVADTRIAAATGIRSLRHAGKGVTPLDLCVRAAAKLMAETGTRTDEIGAVLFVSFTEPNRMPAGACQAQTRLQLPRDVIALDLGLACSGWGYGLYLAALLARQTGRRTLLLDGDVQSAFVDPADTATVPLLADAGTAALVEPSDSTVPWMFSFLSDGADGEALVLPKDGTIRMDGFGVFRFVSIEVTRFIRDFMSATGVTGEDIDAFIPHQANVFMVRKLAEALGVPHEKLGISADELGNSASASVPVTLVRSKVKGEKAKVLFSGFGGGLSASVGLLEIDDQCVLIS